MRSKSAAPQTKFYEIPTMINFPPVHPNEKQSHEQQLWAEISRLKIELKMAKEAFRVAVEENKKYKTCSFVVQRNNELAAALWPFAMKACDVPCGCDNCNVRALLFIPTKQQVEEVCNDKPL